MLFVFIMGLDSVVLLIKLFSEILFDQRVVELCVVSLDHRVKKCCTTNVIFFRNTP